MLGPLESRLVGSPVRHELRRVLQVLGRSAGGVGRHVAQVVEGLDGQGGLTVDVAGPPDLPVRMPKQPIPLVIPNGAARGHAAAIWRLRAILREDTYDVVHAHGLRAGIDSAIAAGRSGPPVLLTLHNVALPDAVGGPKRVLSRRLEDLAVRLSAHTFVPSQDLQARLLERLPGSAAKVELLHAGVGDVPPPLRPATAVREELGLGPDDPLVVTVGRLAPQKRLHVMLAAAQLLPDDVVLAVVGAGPLEGELRGLAGMLGISSRVRFLGFREDARDWIAAADVFCLSSTWEAVSLAAQEAVLLGTPVVATDVGGLPELIADRVSGRLVAVDDAEALADALAELLASGELRRAYAHRAREDYERRFSSRRMLDRLGEVYRGVSRPGGKARRRRVPGSLLLVT